MLDLGEARLPETGLRLGHPLAVETAAGSAEAVFARTFADVGEGELLLYVDSYGSIALAVNRGSAAADAAPRPGRRGRPAPALIMTAFGLPRRHFRVTDSTNERARELALEGAPGGTVVTAEEQTSGRGRRGRAWAAPPGKALLYSAILRPLGRSMPCCRSRCRWPSARPSRRWPRWSAG